VGVDRTEDVNLAESLEEACGLATRGYGDKGTGTFHLKSSANVRPDLRTMVYG
jgi:hypothetical protein